jgi:DHA3 family macrolide efflux protein-like MFS transporter
VRLFRPLSDPPIALLWAGLTTSAIGDYLFSMALTWVAVGLFGAAAGYLTALQAAIVLLVLLGCGHWADRRHPRSVMIAADLVRAAVLIGVMLAWLVPGRPPDWGIILVVLMLAVGEALFRPALQATVPGLITDRSLLLPRIRCWMPRRESRGGSVLAPSCCSPGFCAKLPFATETS